VLRSYQRSWLAHDLVAGVVLTAFLIPVGMGYAQAAGLPPIAGLYATIVPLLVYAIFGPSRVMVLGPDSSLAAVIAAIVAPLALGDPTRAVHLAAMLAIMSGAIIAVAGLCRLGFVTELLSRPVQLGYLAGVAVLIVAGQVPKLLGFANEGDSFFGAAQGIVRAIAAGATNPFACGAGVAAIAIVFLLRRFAPKAPGTLVAVVAGIALSYALDLDAHGVKIVGNLPQGFPTPIVPRVSLDDITRLSQGALAIALIAVTDTTVLSQSLATKRGEEIEPDQELVALGVANIASGLFAGFAISSSSSRTPVAIAAGARTQATSIVGALLVTVLLVAAPSALAALPQPVLAGVVLVAAFGLIDVPGLRRLIRWRQADFALWCIAFLGVTIVGVLEGIFFATLLSLGDFVRRAWRPHHAVLGRVRKLKGYHDLERFPAGRQIPGLALYRFDAPLFFANASHFRRSVRAIIANAEPPVSWFVVCGEPITDIDSTAGQMLEDLHEELDARGIELAFAELKDPVKDRLKRYELYGRIGDPAFFPTIGTAVAAYLEKTGTVWTDWEEDAAAHGPVSKSS